MANLLSEFPPVSTETWEQAIADDLKGADSRARLTWRSPEGFEVKPYYRSDDLAGLHHLEAAPGEFPYVRGTHATGGWRIREQIEQADPEQANQAARAAVAAGAEEIAFEYAALANASDLALLLANLVEIPVRFEHASRATIELLLHRLALGRTGAGVSADLDWCEDAAFSAKVCREAPAGFMPFTVRAENYQESGATAVEEVAFALASGIDYLACMQDQGVTPGQAAALMAFSFSMGPEYFMQIAKLRAFRMTWAQAVESFGASREAARPCIFARTSRWNRTIYDPHVNMLRATTEAMSAVLGGADSIYVAPFDDCYEPGCGTSRRLARNTHIILKQEAHLGRVADAGGGSYYLETLTNAIAARAWKEMQEIEAAGGYRNAEDRIQHRLEERRRERQVLINTRRRVLTGTNRFADPSERALDRAASAPIPDPVRAALPFEQLRLRTERHARGTGCMPRILLAEIGEAKMRAARSNFVAEFLACAGLPAQTERFEDAQQLAQAEADLIVLCSSDPEYLGIAIRVLAEMKARGATIPVWIAGNPESSQQLREAGITEFIHVRSNPIEVLARVQDMLGIGK